MAECDCPLVAQGIVCKHVVKVFKMLHQNIGDIGSIVREIDTLHGITRGGVIPEHNSLKCGFGDDDTKSDDPRNEQLGQKINLKSSKIILNPHVIKM
jgi:hypothetical protein